MWLNLPLICWNDVYLIIDLMVKKHYTKFELFVYNCNLESREMSYGGIGM
jgi:hypothetical protein